VYYGQDHPSIIPPLQMKKNLGIFNNNCDNVICF